MTNNITDDGASQNDMFDAASLALSVDKIASEAPPLDPFDPDALRLSQDFLDDDVASEVLLASVEVRKPKNGEYFRVHPDQSYRLELGIINVEEERSTYVVMKDLHDEVGTDLTPVLLVLAVNRSGTPFLWPVKKTKRGSRPSLWNETARGAAEKAQEHWIRMDSDQAAGCYRVRKATGNLGDPVFPSETFNELLRLGFADRIISKLDHPVLRRLRGEI